MELVRNIHQDKIRLALVDKLAELAQKLGIKTIAEGVETAEELQALQLCLSTTSKVIIFLNRSLFKISVI